MNKTEATAAFEETSFLYGGNAQFIEELYAKYPAEPRRRGRPLAVFL